VCVCVCARKYTVQPLHGVYRQGSSCGSLSREYKKGHGVADAPVKATATIFVGPGCGGTAV